MWKTYKKDAYHRITPYQKVFKDRVVRFGDHGDPTFIPNRVLWIALTFAKGHTDYTKRWHQNFTTNLSGDFMASLDSDIEEQMAQSQGWKTFRVFHTDTEISRSKICHNYPQKLQRPYACRRSHNKCEEER